MSETIHKDGKNQKPLSRMKDRKDDAAEETLYLRSIPGMRESIVEGMKIPLEACASKLEW